MSTPLDKIMSITGQPGLYKLISKTQTRVILESLTDGKRKSMALGHNLSLLSEIQVYGLHEEVSLEAIFDKMLRYESGKKARIEPKAPADELEAYFFEVFKEYDEDRVYSSHIKKIIRWYNVLVENKIIALPPDKEPKKKAPEKPPQEDSNKEPLE